LFQPLVGAEWAETEAEAAAVGATTIAAANENAASSRRQGSFM
jgi:hypothetical protein